MNDIKEKKVNEFVFTDNTTVSDLVDYLHKKKCNVSQHLIGVLEANRRDYCYLTGNEFKSSKTQYKEELELLIKSINNKNKLFTTNELIQSYLKEVNGIDSNEVINFGITDQTIYVKYKTEFNEVAENWINILDYITFLFNKR